MFTYSLYSLAILVIHAVLYVTVVTQVLDGVRPFLSVAGGAISVDKLEGVGGLQVLHTVFHTVLNTSLIAASTSETPSHCLL
jgi:hypothetical protein